MALVQHNNLPSIDRVAAEGIDVHVPNKANSGLGVINIGFLNMMPDAAIAATERQFLRLLGSSDQISCKVFPFTIAGIERSPQARAYIRQYYSTFDDLKFNKLDAMVITGANVMQPKLTNESFWDGLREVLIWSKGNVKSTICSCLATHAAVKVFYNINRRHLGKKCWGVYEHNVENSSHVLTMGVSDKIKMCHSRYNDISYDDFKRQQIDNLIVSDEAGVQLAAEKDLSMVYFQGHPEYDDISLLKEYKREIFLYLSTEREDYPPTPENYFDQKSVAYIEAYKKLVKSQPPTIDLIEKFPEAELKAGVKNPWKQASNMLFKHWIENFNKI